jgi:bacillolysin
MTLPALIGYSDMGTFHTRYSGTRQGITQYYNGVYNLSDSTRGAIIHTWNLQNSTDISSRVEITDNDNIWTIAEHRPNNNDMGQDVHWALQQIYDHFSDNYTISSFDNNNHRIDAYIRYGYYNVERDNAFWDPYHSVLYFGDGVEIFSPVASVDVVGHEYGHAITQFQIGWQYSGNGAVFHEGMSDIWGVILESRIRPNSIWQIGEQVTLTHSCIRNIQNPDDPTALNQIANTFGSSQYDGSDCNHYCRSGVFSHWFYLLVNGGSGTNDIGNSYSVCGVGMDAAEELIVAAVFDGFLEYTTTYPEIRTSIQQATRSLNNQQYSFLEQQVGNAWYAVGVGSEPDPLSITGPSLVCNTNTTFSLDNLPPNYFVTWDQSYYLTYVSGQGTANYTVKATGLTTSGEGWVQATITGECGTVVLRKDVWVGIPKKPSHIVFVPHTPCTNQFVLAYFNEINPPISQVYYQWSSGDHVFFPQGESSTWFQTKGPLPYITNVHVSAQNICGSNILTQLLTVQECGGGGIPPVPPASDPETPLLVISPNPAGDYIDVSINNVSQQLQGNEVYVMTIYDRFSQVVRNVTTDVPHVRIPVYNLPTGTYVLTVVSGDQARLHGKFIIQR